MELVKSQTGFLHIIFNKEEQKLLFNFIAGGSQGQIEFDEANVEKNELLVDPLKGCQDNTKKAIIELIKRYKNSPFTTNDFMDIRKKYYVPALSETIKKLAKNELASIQSLTHRHKVYQFSEKLCRHFGN